MRHHVRFLVHRNLFAAVLSAERNRIEQRSCCRVNHVFEFLPSDRVVQHEVQIAIDGRELRQQGERRRQIGDRLQHRQLDFRHRDGIAQVELV